MDSGLGDHIRAAMLWHPFDSEKQSNKEIRVGIHWRKTETVILFLDVSGKHMMDRRTIGEDGGHRGELLFKSRSLASNQNPRSVAGAAVVCTSEHREQN